jgi:pimeloyl-ACP methyl ester carboxylesterase
MKERSIVFGKQKSLVGIVTEPSHIDSTIPAVIMLNGGLVHHIGPNRLYVKLSRCLAEQGNLAFRFDFSGIGDSKVRNDNLPFEKSTIDDAQQAMDFLQSTYGISQFLVMGHCSGAFNSFRVATEDERVISIILMNPEGGNLDWDVYDRKRKEILYYSRYYSKVAVRDPARWRRLLTGKADYRSIMRNVFNTILLNRLRTLKFKFLSQTPKAEDPARQVLIDALNKLAARNTRIFFIYSENSTGLERIQAYLGRNLKDMVASGVIRLEVLSHADHNYTLQLTQRDLMGLISNWVSTLLPAASEP